MSSDQGGAAIRALVIGAGPATTHAHLPVMQRLREHGRLLLDTVCDIDPVRAAAACSRFGFAQRTGDALAATARPDIDAVYIFGSAQMHYQYGLAALTQGKHLFVEKPVAPAYVQALELARLARERQLIAAGGHNRRFFKSLVEVRRRGGQTRWRQAEVTSHKSELGHPPSFGAQTWLRGNGIHALDAMLYVMGGLPEHLTAAAARGGAEEPAVFSALMRWRDGSQGTFACNNHAGERREAYVFHAPGESYRVGDEGLTIAGPRGQEHLRLPLTGDGFEAEHAAFLDAIRDHVEPRHSLAAIAPSLFLAELIEAGFNGAVHLPAERSVPGWVGPRAGRRVLVVPSTELQPVLARHLSAYRWLSLDDVLQSREPLPDVEAAILGRGSAQLPQSVLDKLPGLRVIGISALSLARYEPDALLARGITLLNATHAYAHSVAEFAFALAVLARRRAFFSHRLMLAGGWGTASPPGIVAGLLKSIGQRLRPLARAVRLEQTGLRVWRAGRGTLNIDASTPAATRELRDAHVGLIGWGANAGALTERLLAAGARVLVFSEHAAPAQLIAAGAIPASLAEVLACDVVSLHRGLTAATRHGLRTAELARLRPGSVLINIARGALIEPRALRARLRRGDIFACLDTYDEEPLGARDPLRRARNVFLTSHIAGGSREMHAAAAAEVVEKVLRFLQDGGVQGIGAERLRTMS
jgi:phosphoglycerate dehydrogenase-like enzyme/predicted dehydrogenase